MTGQLPPQNEDAEIGVLGAALLSDNAIAAIGVEVQLRPEHFYRYRHGHIWRAMLKLSGDGQPVDAVTVCEQLERDMAAGDERCQVHGGFVRECYGEELDLPQRSYVYALANTVPAAGNAVSYARIVAEKAQWRRRLNVGREIQEAAASEDQDAFARAEAQLVHSDEARRRTSTPEDLAERLYQFLTDDQPEDVFPWPFRRLNQLTNGGMRRGKLTLVPAWSSHGKSAFITQVLGYLAERPERWRTHFYFNEDTEDEHLMRLAARMARVPKSRIETKHLSDEERARVANVMSRIPFGMTDCTGWSAEDVVRDMVHRRWDVVGIDGLGQFPGARKREELEEISRVLNQAVKPARANCHVLLAHHLNRSQVSGTSPVLPFPQLGSIRDSSRLSDDADSVLFVYRDQDEDTGEPQASGLLRFAKGRNHRLGGMQVTFEGDYQRFEAGGFNAERWHEQAEGAVPA